MFTYTHSGSHQEGRYQNMGAGHSHTSVGHLSVAGQTGSCKNHLDHGDEAD